MGTLQLDTGSSHWIAYQFLSGFGLGFRVRTILPLSACSAHTVTVLPLLFSTCTQWQAVRYVWYTKESAQQTNARAPTTRIQTGGLAMQTVLPADLVSTGVALNMFAQQLGFPPRAACSSQRAIRTPNRRHLRVEPPTYGNCCDGSWLRAISHFSRRFCARLDGQRSPTPAL
jgi:hypothetical protein